MKAATWVKGLLRRGRLEAEMEEEMRFHVEARAEELRRAGLGEAQAKRQARVEFGGWESHKDGVREAWGLRWVDEVWGDVRYAWRTLRRSPVFTAVAVGSLALAIGANTNIFSVTHELLYLRLGVPRAQELRMLTVSAPQPTVMHSSWGSSTSKDGRSWKDSVPYPVFAQIRAKSRTVEGVAGFKDLYRVSVTAKGEARPQMAQVVSGNLYNVLEVKPQLGRAILPSDEGPAGTGFVAVISNRYWKTVFGGRKDVLGTAIRVNGNTVTIVGVNPAGFTGASSTTSSPDLFLPISLTPRLRPSFSEESNFINSPDVWWVNMVARARPGVPDAQAAAELSLLLESAVRSAGPVKKGEHIPRVEITDGSRGLVFFEESAPLHILLALTGLVLLLACVNIANLMLARTSARMREVSVRLALGASRARVMRQVITESLLISALGGTVGALVGWLGRNLLLKLYLGGRTYATSPVDVHFSWTVLWVTAAVTIGTGLLFGLLPAWRATRADVSAGLKDTGRGATRRRGLWVGKALISLQLALSTVLVAGAALFVRTLWNLHHVDPGFPTANLLEFDVEAPNQQYPGAAAGALMARLHGRLAALPGLGQMAMARPMLLDGFSWNNTFEAEGKPMQPGKDGGFEHIVLTTVTPNFFRVMQIPIVRGRGFTEGDSATDTRVAIINEATAKKFFPGEEALGRRFTHTFLEKGKDMREWYTIVGICKDTLYSDLRGERGPIEFDPMPQTKDVNSATFVIRTTLPTAEAVPMLRKAVAEIDPDLPLMNVRTLDERIADSMHQERLIATLTAGFGVLALLLASVGIYGLMAYTVAQRTGEIGIRLALGAQRMEVRVRVLKEVTVLTVAGLVVGGVGVVVALRLLRSVLFGTEGDGMLYGLRGYDPVSLCVTAAVLCAVALVAAWVPAARASRVEPMEALRHE